MRFPSAAWAALLLAALPSEAAMVCSGSSASISLGGYIGDTSTPLDSIGSFSLTCARDGGSPTATVTMGIGPSSTSGAIASRQLRRVGGADVLSYNVFRDALRSSVWGQTTGLDTVTQSVVVPNKASASLLFTIYGRVPGLQSVSVGSYQDNLLVTIQY